MTHREEFLNKVEELYSERFDARQGVKDRFNGGANVLFATNSRRGAFDEVIDFAIEKHDGHLRKTDHSDYIEHPIRVALTLYKNGYHQDTVMAGLLHDTVEDTDTTLREISTLFGERVAYIVGQHTENKDLTWVQRKSHTHVVVAEGNEDVNALIVADKLDNLTDMAKVPFDLWSTFFKEDFLNHYWYNLGVYLNAKATTPNIPYLEEFGDLINQVFVDKEQDLTDTIYFDTETTREGMTQHQLDQLVHLEDKFNKSINLQRGEGVYIQVDPKGSVTPQFVKQSIEEDENGWEDIELEMDNETGNTLEEEAKRVMAILSGGGFLTKDLDIGEGTIYTETMRRTPKEDEIKEEEPLKTPEQEFADFEQKLKESLEEEEEVVEDINEDYTEEDRDIEELKTVIDELRVELDTAVGREKLALQQVLNVLEHKLSEYYAGVKESSKPVEDTATFEDTIKETTKKAEEKMWEWTDTFKQTDTYEKARNILNGENADAVKDLAKEQYEDLKGLINKFKGN